MRRTDQRRAAIFALYEHEVTGAPLADLIERGPFPDVHGAEQEAPVQAGPLTEFAGEPGARRARSTDPSWMR